MTSRSLAAALAAAVLLGGATLGCATTSSEKQPWPTPPPAPARPFDPVTFAASYRLGADCESAARGLKARSKDQAWSALLACAGQGNFTSLRELLAGWGPELRTRNEAPALIAKVIAMRGGSIPMELRLLHEHRVPLFSLQDGISQPETYKGRLVVVRAKVGEQRAENGAVTVKLQEYGLRSMLFESPEGRGRRKVSTVDGDGAVQGTLPLLGGAPVGGRLVGTTDTTEHETVRRYDNVSAETGREALARLPAADPFLEPEKEFVILARFDGVRETSNSEDEDDPDRLAVLTVISFSEPAPLVVY